MFNDILQIPVDRQLWFLALFAWTLLWKGMALWKAAQKGSKPWFIVFLLINTLGILEILYVYVISRPRGEAKSTA
jgi:hypothetical protein